MGEDVEQVIADELRAAWGLDADGNQHGHVKRGRVRKADVIAYFTTRNEAEIVAIEVER